MHIYRYMRIHTHTHIHVFYFISETSFLRNMTLNNLYNI